MYPPLFVRGSGQLSTAPILPVNMVLGYHIVRTVSNFGQLRLGGQDLLGFNRPSSTR